jgi:predicted transcriptional regulator
MRARLGAIRIDLVVPSLHDKRHRTVYSLMRTLKSETLTVRLCPETKAALRQAAEQERRSLSNMLDVMIRAYAATQRADSLSVRDSDERKRAGMS